MLIFLMIGIDDGNMGRKQSRTTSFLENFGLQFSPRRVCVLDAF